MMESQSADAEPPPPPKPELRYPGLSRGPAEGTHPHYNVLPFSFLDNYTESGLLYYVTELAIL